MGITIKCGESTELIQNVLEEIEKKMPDVLWGAGQSPASWNPKTTYTSYGGSESHHVVLFIDESSNLTYIIDSEEYIEYYISQHHGNDNIICAEDFISSETSEDIQNETDISFLFD